jgi:RimK family alpha-L-glutamate ligase
MKFAVIAHKVTETNIGLASRGWRGARPYLLAPRDALLALGPGDVVLNRLDVSPDLDGVEEGNWIVNQLEAQGIRVLNRPPALLAAHDKLITARLLKAAGVPHPQTQRLDGTSPAGGLVFPVVAKPRFGSWGRDVELCADRKALASYTAAMKRRTWWRAGAIVQEMVPPHSRDLRVIVSGDEVVGAASRRAGEGEWRTNVALGATIVSATPPAAACELAVAATKALGIDFAGVDLLPVRDGWVVLEVNGAVDVRPLYALGRDVFDAALSSLERESPKPALLA